MVTPTQAKEGIDHAIDGSHITREGGVHGNA
jgi:hypothetical protein